jgi:hypothetical protein
MELGSRTSVAESDRIYGVSKTLDQLILLR